MMICVENCFRGTSPLPTLVTPRAKKKKKKEEDEDEEGAPKERSFSDLLRRDYLRDPSQWYDMRSSKTNPTSPDFMLTSTKESLCINGWYSSCWLKGMHRNLQDVDFYVKRKKSREVNGIHHKAQQEGKVLIVKQSNHQKFHDDTRVAVAFVASLKACAKQKNLQRGSQIHIDVDRKGLLQKNVFVGSSLVSMYAKCGALEKAQEVFDNLPNRNVVLWNALIAGYAQNGHSKKALNCFERMQLEGLVPDAVTFTCILKACGSVGDSDKGQDLHTQILREQLLEKDIVVGNALIDMYGKCGVLDKAQEVFDELPVRNVVSWTALITGYTQHGHGEEALHCFEQMQLGGLSPDAVTFSCILKACGCIGALGKGEEIHDQMKRECLLGKDVVIANALVDMYVKCGALEKAQEVFDELRFRNVVSWNGLIAGYAQHGHGEEALNCFGQMQREGFSPDAVTLASTLTACGTIGALEKGQEIHAQIVREHLLRKDVVVAGALVDMYAKCGNLERAQEVFDELSVRDVVSWTSLIAGYVEHGLGEEALNCFKRMQLSGFSPNAITFACVLKACGNMGTLVMGQKIHAEIAKEERYLEKDTVVGTALVDMYAKCGAFIKAQEVFDNLSVLDVISWNALIGGYAQHGHGNEALECFEHMQREGFRPDAVTFACLLKACGSAGAAGMGLELHADIVKLGFTDEVAVLGTVLVDMYANCGMLIEAEEVFCELAVRDVVSWSVLMEGYAQLGKDEIVPNLFDEMIKEDIVPTSVTFTIVLNACSHRGLVEEGQFYFEILSKTYGIIPTLQHHSCMIDLFGRAGHLDSAIALIESMPLSADLAMWHTLLGACRTSVNQKLGRFAFEHAVQLDENDDAAFICMGDLYAAAG